jgi:hypothetical protein
MKSAFVFASMLLASACSQAAVIAAGHVTVDGERFAVKDAVLEPSRDDIGLISVHFSTVKLLPADLAEIQKSSVSNGLFRFRQSERVKAITPEPVFVFVVVFNGDKTQFQHGDLKSCTLRKGRINHQMYGDKGKQAIQKTVLQWGKQSGKFLLMSKSAATVRDSKVSWDLKVKGDVMITDHMVNMFNGGSESGTIHLANGKTRAIGKARYFYASSDRKGFHAGAVIPQGNGTTERHMSIRDAKSFTVDSFGSVSGTKLTDVKGTVVLKNGTTTKLEYKTFSGIDFWEPHPKTGLPIRAKVNAAESGRQLIKRITFN